MPISAMAQSINHDLDLYDGKNEKCIKKYFIKLGIKPNTNVNFKKFTVDRTANPSFLLFDFLNYKEVIRAFPNHTAGFTLVLWFLCYIY